MSASRTLSSSVQINNVTSDKKLEEYRSQTFDQRVGMKYCLLLRSFLSSPVVSLNEGSRQRHAEIAMRERRRYFRRVYLVRQIERAENASETSLCVTLSFWLLIFFLRFPRS